MDFSEVLALFGGTIFPEEYRYDFEQVEPKIRTMEEEASLSGAPIECRAKAILVRAIYYMHSGHIANSLDLIEKLLQLEEVGLGRRWLLRGEIYRFFALVLQQRPPLLRFYFTTGDLWVAPPATQASVDASFPQAFGVLQQLKSIQPSNPLDVWESMTILDTLNFSSVLHLSYLSHPDYTKLSGIDRLAPEDRVHVSLDMDSQGSSEIMAKYGKPAMKRSLERFQVEVELAKATESGFERLSKLFSEYEASGDLIGMALCKIIQGDSIISRPFTNPVALNLICQVRGVAWENELWDTQERVFSLCSNPEAQECYRVARFHMDAAGCCRGQAAVLLRESCIHHAEALRHEAKDDHSQAQRQYYLAEEDASNALQLCGRDVTQAQLVTCHQILQDVSRRRPRDVVYRSRRLGCWLQETQNYRTSHFIGALMLRFARSHFTSQRDFAVATSALDSAEAYYAGMDHPIGSFAAVCAHLKLLKESQNTWVAQAMVRRVIQPDGVLLKALAYVDSLASTAAPDAHHRTLHMRRDTMIREFDGIVRSILHSSQDSTLQREFEPLLERIRDNAPLNTSLPIMVAEMKKHVKGSTITPENLQLQMAKLSDVKKLWNAYHESVAMSLASIGNGNVEDAEFHLESFIARYDREEGRGNKETVTAKFLALTQLGRVMEMRQLLPDSLSEFFAKDSGESIRISLMAKGLSSQEIEDEVLVRRHAACEDIAKTFLAQDWTRGAVLLRNISVILPEFLQRTSLAAEAGNWQLMTWIAAIYEHNGDHKEALSWYLGALHQVEHLRQMVPDPDRRAKLTSSLHSTELYCGLVRLCLAFDRECSQQKVYTPHSQGLAATSWIEQALLFVEQCRARSLLDVVQANEAADTEKVQDWMEKTYRYRLISSLHTMPAETGRRMSEEEVARRLGIKKEAFDKVESALQCRQETASILLRGTLFQPDANSLLISIPPDSLVIQLGICMSSLVVLCMSTSGVECVHEANIGVFELRKLVSTYIGEMKKIGTEIEENGHGTELPLALKKKLVDIAATISSYIIEPFSAIIEKKNSVILAPASYLSKFPVGALIFNKAPLVLRKIVYQVPSLSVLRELSKSASKPIRLTSVSVCVPGQNDVENQRPLYFSGPEAASVSKSMATAPTSGGRLTAKEFQSMFETSDIVHVSAHGSYLYSSPWESYFRLQEPYRVVDLTQVRCRSGLVVFGACHTGESTTAGGDDAIGFAHAVLQSGALSFVGGLWALDDRTSMLLMHIFYKRLRQASQQEYGACIAECWQKSVKELYYLDQTSERILLEEIEAIWATAQENGIRPEGREFKFSRGKLRIAQQEVRTQPLDFSHPFYWAAFSLVGYGSLIFKASSGADMKATKTGSPLPTTGKKGADVIVANKDGEPSLHWASQNGHIEVVKALLEKGADVAVTNDSGQTPLHLASQNGHLQVVKALLEKGANVMVADKDGRTPLDLASCSSVGSALIDGILV